MNYSSPLLSIRRVVEPGVSLMEEGEIVDDQISPVGEVAMLRADAAEPGE